jgi:hypothetical protein
MIKYLAKKKNGSKGKKQAKHPKYGMTEGKFVGKLKAALRKEWRNSQMYKDAVLNARIPCTDSSKKKWVVPCAYCGDTYYLKEKVKVPAAKGGMKETSAYNIDHIKGCGPFTTLAHAGAYILKLFCSVSGLQVLCYQCHDIKTMEEKS